MNYTAEVMKSAQASLERLYNCENSIKRVLADKSGGAVNTSVSELIAMHKARFIEAMDDDLNTADALSVVFELVREINKTLEISTTTKADAEALHALFRELTGILGLLYQDKEADIPADVNELLEKRKAARADKNFALADQIRGEITAFGYTVEETRQGTVVRKA
jgi:cysteinyl-tRNA synthetase